MEVSLFDILRTTSSTAQDSRCMAWHKDGGPNCQGKHVATYIEICSLGTWASHWLGERDVGHVNHVVQQ